MVRGAHDSRLWTQHLIAFFIVHMLQHVFLIGGGVKREPHRGVRAAKRPQR